MCPFLVLLQTHLEISGPKASNACGLTWRCPASASRAHTDYLSHRDLLCSWVSTSPPLGTDAATRHGPSLTLVLLLSKSAVRNHCHNMPLSSQHTTPTYSGCHQCCIGILGQAIWGPVENCKDPLSLPCVPPFSELSKNGCLGCKLYRVFIEIAVMR